ncbi:carbon-phosphorus lyase complex subunit PhnI [Pseudonocardia aurantiaca]|uniref:Carbon-phosphorus lyase complex subunit PhnI n=1 Tax=Pseudonocardia aurantiaca TaxID=75290 RepID=A0ABW4FTL5_9PSEU
MYATLQDGPGLAAAREIAERQRVAEMGHGLAVLEDQVCVEAGVWAPDAARRAIAQVGGDVPRAVALLRVWAATLPHLHSCPVAESDIRIERRISSAYPEIPGGQWLGFAPDLAPRILSWDDEPEPGSTAGDDEAVDLEDIDADAPSRAAVPRVRDLLEGLPVRVEPSDGDGLDPAAGTPVPPLGRATRGGVLAGGETAGLVTLASLILGRRREAVLAELTVNAVSLRVPHPRTGTPCVVAELPVVEAEAVIDADVDGAAGFAVGWGASMGSIERRAISLALIDGAVQADGELEESIPLDEQTVVGATDGSANNGFVEHLRLPHYASFASYVAQARAGTRGEDT